MDVILLEITLIKGNCTLAGHIDQIVVDSFSHSVSLPMSGDMANTERTAGRPQFSEMTFSKMMDKSTPALYAACTAGTKLDKATVHIGRNEAGVFMSLMKYVMTNPMVSNISTSGGGGIPSDSFSLNYTKITSEFTQQNPDSTKKGVATWGWDLTTNVAA